MSVSAVILTYNDRETITDCLDSVEWCDEIVVVDSYSDDGTEEIVAKRADIVVRVPPASEGEPFDHFRSEGFEAASNEWIVPIDADERMPKTLTKRLRELAATDCADVVWALRKNLFDGRWLSGGYWWPDYQPWLIQDNMVTITPDVHDFYDFDDDSRHLRLPPEERFAVIHRKADSYREAYETARRHAKIRAKQEEFRPKKLGAFFYTFWKFYIDSQSYKDGVPGLVLSLIYSLYRFETVIRSLGNS
jgi:glycosyltransferase involved in cell wall biosynthesis